MKYRQPILILSMLLFFSTCSYAQSASGVISPSRAADWSHAGVTGGIPSASWTQCGATIQAYNGTTDKINNAINSCGANQYVQLGAGTFNLTAGGSVSGGIRFVNKSNVALRGMGADQTFLVFGSGASDSCSGGYHAAICMNGSNGAYWVQDAPVSWTAGYAQGTTVITLSSVTGIVPNQTIIGLDQCSAGNSGSPCSMNAEPDNGNFFDCDITFNGTNGCSVNGPDSSNQRSNRPQNELFQVSAVNTSTKQVTLIGSLRNPNWNAAQTPQAYVALAPDQYDGVENLSMDTTNTGALAAVAGYYVANSWVKGVRIIEPNYSGVWWIVGVHNSLVDSYIFSNSHLGSGSDIFSMNAAPSSDNLFQNNISQWNQVCMGNEGGDTGSVYAYNYCLNDYNGNDGIYPAVFPHAGDRYQLFEGNILNSYYAENYHGPKIMNTLFRNFIPGWESCGNGANASTKPCGTFTAKDSATTAIRMVAYSRYHNLVGNVLGTPGYHNSYSTTGAFSVGNIYEIGSPNNMPVDPVVASTLLRWGNYDVVSGTVHWCGSSSDSGWSSACGSKSEVPSGISAYPNSVPTVGDTAAGQSALPASFYLPGKPSWFGSLAWPAIGPDVTGGNVGQCGGTLNTPGKYNGVAATSSSQCAGSSLNTAWGGHISATPAMNCFLNIMGGAPDGSNGLLNFNAAACYGSEGSPINSQGPAPPTNLTVVVN